MFPYDSLMLHSLMGRDHHHHHHDWHPTRYFGSSSVSDRDPHRFQLCVDVHQFGPEEVSVKTVGRQIIIEGKHEEKQDEHGFVYRHFVRKYDLPEGYEPNDVISSLSSDGVLTVTARNPIVLPDKDERIVPIQQTGPMHYYVKEHKVDHEAAKRARAHPRKEPEVVLAIKYI